MSRSRPKAVFDTNIFIQAFLNPSGPSGRCFNLARERRTQLFVSEKGLTEIEEVIARPSIRSILPETFAESVERFLAEIKSTAYHATGSVGIFKLDRDPKDELIIELAVGCDADFIISWDKDLLELMTGFDSAGKEFRQRFRGIRIVNPNEFLRIVSEIDMALDP